MDDLDRIESIYGSVAEYNRVRFEENQEPIKRTAEEQLDGARRMAVYHEKIRLLSGIPSEFVKKLVEDWAKKEPKQSDFENRNYYINAGYEYACERTQDITRKICDYYRVNCDDEWATFYRPGLKQFAISTKYTDSGSICHLNIGPLSLDQFKQIFCDLYYAKLNPSMSYGKEEEKPIMISNSSLGSIRLAYLSSVESKEELNEELRQLGFNEEKFAEEYKAEHENDFEDELTD